MLASLLFVAVSVGFALINQKVGLVSTTHLWVVVFVSLLFCTFGAVGYRCPYCNKFPEKDDVPTFNPMSCGHCGGKLK